MPYKDKEKVYQYYLRKNRIEERGGVYCPICNRMYLSVGCHMKRSHDISIMEYRKKNRLPLKYSFTAKTTMGKLINNGKENWRKNGKKISSKYREHIKKNGPNVYQYFYKKEITRDKYGLNFCEMARKLGGSPSKYWKWHKAGILLKILKKELPEPSKAIELRVSSQYCPQGHLRTLGNTFYDKKGTKKCRICTRKAITDWYHRIGKLKRLNKKINGTQNI